MIYVLLVVAVIVGALMPVQASINAQLTRLVQHPYLGAFISFTTGTLVLAALVLTKGFPFTELKRLSGASPSMFLGGVFGAMFVGSSIFLIPKLGPTLMVAAFITGQLMGSMVIDHFGLFGIQQNPINATKVVGVSLLFLGIYLIMRKNA